MDVIDLMSPVQEAVYRALAASVTMTDVYDHVRQGIEPPFVKVGTIALANEGSKDEQRDRFEVEVHTIYRGANRSELFAIMHQVRAALDEQPITAAGLDLSSPVLLTAVAGDASSDGVTYAGISTFEIFAEPA